MTFDPSRYRVELRDGRSQGVYKLPDGTEGDTGRCKSCKADIVWIKTKTGRSAPMNHDGTSHFSTCPQAEQWRFRARTRA